MIYRSSLTAPDLRLYFRLLDPPRQHCGYDAPSDPDFDPACTFWTMDEAAILYNVAKSVPPGNWVDIGARLGWTAAHVMAAGHLAVLIDPEFRYQAFTARMEQNLYQQWRSVSQVWGEEWGKVSAKLIPSAQYDGFVIDGCHDSPEPLNDAMGAAAHAKPDCIILFHDFLGPAIRDAVRWLMDNGWRCRVYWTPNGVACCWRGHQAEPPGYWSPPMHTPDPAMDFRPHRAAMVDFQDYWSRCE